MDFDDPSSGGEPPSFADRDPVAKGALADASDSDNDDDSSTGLFAGIGGGNGPRSSWRPPWLTPPVMVIGVAVLLAGGLLMRRRSDTV